MNARRNRSIVVTMIVGMCAVWAAPARAQSNDEVFPSFQFNFSTPGARANALGRAFIGLADDASASITNPAGLLRLTRPQASIEFKNTTLDVDRLASADSLTTLKPTTFSSTINSVSFFSVSAPIGDNLAVAFTRHEFLNYREKFDLAERPIPGHPLGHSFFPVHGDSNFKGTDYAGSIAFAMSDKVKVGASLSLNQLSAKSEATRIGFLVTDNSTTVIDDTASAMGAAFGILLQPNPKISVGVQFTKGPHFTVSEDVVNSSNQSFFGFPADVHINVPDRFGFGIAARPNSRFLVALDVVHIGYSSLTKDFLVIFDSDELIADDYEIDDVVEVHAGGEFLILSTSTHRIFLRGGVFTSPDHRTKFLGSLDPAVDAVWNATYNLLPRKTDVVGTVGAGIVVGAHLQADVAYVVGREVVASLGFRF